MLSSFILVVGFFIIGICAIVYSFLRQPDTPTRSEGKVAKYDFDINEHQNYWEADGR